jgi:hypothetical protein
MYKNIPLYVRHFHPNMFHLRNLLITVNEQPVKPKRVPATAKNALVTYSFGNTWQYISPSRKIEREIPQHSLSNWIHEFNNLDQTNNNLNKTNKENIEKFKHSFFYQPSNNSPFKTILKKEYLMSLSIGDRNRINYIITNFFISLHQIISEPIYLITPNKLKIKIFHYSIYQNRLNNIQNEMIDKDININKMPLKTLKKRIWRLRRYKKFLWRYQGLHKNWIWPTTKIHRAYIGGNFKYLKKWKQIIKAIKIWKYHMKPTNNLKNSYYKLFKWINYNEQLNQESSVNLTQKILREKLQYFKKWKKENNKLITKWYKWQKKNNWKKKYYNKIKLFQKNQYNKHWHQIPHYYNKQIKPLPLNSYQHLFNMINKDTQTYAISTQNKLKMKERKFITDILQYKKNKDTNNFYNKLTNKKNKTKLDTSIIKNIMEKNTTKIKSTPETIWENFLNKQDSSILNNKKIEYPYPYQSPNFYWKPNKKYNELNQFKYSIQKIQFILSKILNIDVEFEIQKVKHFVLNSDILTKMVAMFHKNKKFYKLTKHVFKKARMHYGQFFLRDSKKIHLDHGLPHQITGIQFKLGGRWLRERTRPKKTKQRTEIGSFVRTETNFTVKSRVINKNKKGANTIKLALSAKNLTYLNKDLSKKAKDLGFKQILEYYNYKQTPQHQKRKIDLIKKYFPQYHHLIKNKDTKNTTQKT